MNSRFISPIKRPQSSFWCFRMVVPERYREAVGKREILRSLKTLDLVDAKRQCVALQQEWQARFEQIGSQQRGQSTEAAVRAVDGYLAAEAREMGGMDRAVAFELEGLAIAETSRFHPIDLPSDDDGDTAKNDPVADQPPINSDAIERRLDVLSRDESARVLPGVEAARRIQVSEQWSMMAGFIEEAFAHAGVPQPTVGEVIATAARHLVERLLAHHQPQLAELEAAFPGPAIPNSARRPFAAVDASDQTARPATARSELQQAILGAAGKARTISEVFEVWAAAQPAERAKIAHEWRKDISRFVDLHGDLPVTEVTSEMVLDYRDAMLAMPKHPPKSVSGRSIIEQITFARNENYEHRSGPTVAKALSGLRVTLGYARDPLRLIALNPASGVSVPNAKSPADARVRFDEGELRRLFASSKMIDQTDGGALDDFWMVLLAPLTGLRLEEAGKLRPRNIRCERDIWYISVELDPLELRRENTAQGKANKTAKTLSSFRDIPVHWLLTEAGFLDFVERQRVAREDWLFASFEPDRYGTRTNYLSRRLNRWLRKVGIADEEKVFYSFRHSMKRACRDSNMKEEIADLLAGHAPATVGRKYGAGAALNVLQQAVNMIEYPSVDWDPVIKCAKQRLAQLR